MASREILGQATRLLTPAVIMLCAACATAPNPALERAQQSYAQARQDPEVTTNAPVALHEAEQSLRKAEQAESEEQKTHLAYIAEKRVDIARAEAQKKTADAEAQRVLKQRDKILLEARERELAELKAKKTSRGLVLTLGDVLFEYNRAELKPGALQNLYRLVAFLKENSGRSVSIEGHTDSTGSDSYNLALSQRRAQSVEEFLLRGGVSRERIRARGYGEAYPVANNDTAAGRQHNRRVEIVISEEGRPIQALP